MGSHAPAGRLIDPAEGVSGVLLHVEAAADGGLVDAIRVARDLREAWRDGPEATGGLVALAVPTALLPVTPAQLDAAEQAGPWSPSEREVVDEIARAALAQPNGVPLFGVEAHRAGVIAHVIRCLSGDSIDAQSVTAARVAQIASIVDRFSSDPRLTPDAIAAALGISRRTLYDLAADPLGGISQHIRLVRARAAAELLAHTDGEDRPLSRIAARVGFSSARQLIRAIEAVYDMTPDELRGRGVRASEE